MPNTEMVYTFCLVQRKTIVCDGDIGRNTGFLYRTSFDGNSTNSDHGNGQWKSHHHTNYHACPPRPIIHGFFQKVPVAAVSAIRTNSRTAQTKHEYQWCQNVDPKNKRIFFENSKSAYFLLMYFSCSCHKT